MILRGERAGISLPEIFDAESMMRKFMLLGVTIAALTLAGCATGPSAGLAKGWKLMVSQKFPAAVDQYQKVLKKYPDNPYAHLNLGVAYQRLDKTDLARQQYQAAVKYGGSAQVTQVAQEKGVNARTTTVADLARQNLKTLP